MTIGELKELYSKMTPGPWVRRGQYVCVGVGGGDKQEIGDGRLGEGGCVFGETPSAAAAEQNFPGIVALHNHFPELMERYEAMRAALEVAAITIDGLSEQQAMPDNWYIPKANQVLDALANATKPLGGKP